MRLRGVGQEQAKLHAHRIADGESIWWEFNDHGGCKCSHETCQIGVRGRMKTVGARRAALAHLAGRRGAVGRNLLRANHIDGYAQILRDQSGEDEQSKINDSNALRKGGTRRPKRENVRESRLSGNNMCNSPCADRTICVPNGGRFSY